MPLDPSIILGVQPAPLQSPLQAISAIAQLQDVQAQVEQRRQAGEAARQKARDDAQVRSVFAAAGGDVDAALKQLYTVNPRAAAPLAEQVGKARKEQLDAMGKDLTNQKLRAELALQIGQTVNDGQSYSMARPAMVATSPVLDKILPPADAPWDPDRWSQIMQAGVSGKDLLEHKQKVVDLFANGKVNEAVGTALSALKPDDPTAGAQATKYLDGAKALGAPEVILAPYRALLTPDGAWAPDASARAAQLAITPKERETLAGQAATRAQTAANEAAIREQATHSPIYKEWQDYQAQGGTLGFDAYMTKDANRKAATIRVNTGAGQPGDLKEAIAGMKDGTLPPQLPGRGSAAYTGLMAEAHRQGFDLASAATDWTAAQKHFATLNGAQQTRLRQAVDTAAHSLDVIDTLAGQWQGGRFPILNRANLALAKNGVYGPEVATTARQLDAQIADVTAELANAYMGGNSPTDHALALAAKNLSSDWSEKTLKDMTALARTNLTIRQNAIKNIGAIGASDVNPYVPAPAAAATPKRYNPATGKVE